MKGTRIADFLELKEKEDSILDYIEYLGRTHYIDRKKIIEAKAKVSSAIHSLTGGVDLTKQISDKDMSKIINQIHDMAKRGKRRFFLELKDDNSGILDILDKHEYLFEKRR